MSSAPTLRPPASGDSEKRPVAVIDIGATSIRMAIAEIDPSGNIRPIETLSQAVTLGKDTFTQRRIRKQSIEECVRVLKSYRKKLAEYGITRQACSVRYKARHESRARFCRKARVHQRRGPYRRTCFCE